MPRNKYGMHKIFQALLGTSAGPRAGCWSTSADPHPKPPANKKLTLCARKITRTTGVNEEVYPMAQHFASCLSWLETKASQPHSPPSWGTLWPDKLGAKCFELSWSWISAIFEFQNESKTKTRYSLYGMQVHIRTIMMTWWNIEESWNAWNIFRGASTISLQIWCCTTWELLAAPSHQVHQRVPVNRNMQNSHGLTISPTQSNYFWSKYQVLLVCCSKHRRGVFICWNQLLFTSWWSPEDPSEGKPP